MKTPTKKKRRGNIKPQIYAIKSLAGNARHPQSRETFPLKAARQKTALTLQCQKRF